GTFRAAAERSHEATGAAFKYVLVDVFFSGPGEGARVIVAQHEQRRVVHSRPGALREDQVREGGEVVALGLVLRSVKGLQGIEDDGGSSVGAMVHGQHEGREAEHVPKTR
uniref:Integron gene cassette protein n=1 Tax=Steinernema glaseri TaxID=37863 RepID=A0A1I7Y841_9BILA